MTANPIEAFEQQPGRQIGQRSRICQGNALELAARLPAGTVHLTFTSPPYHAYKTYGVSDDPADLGRPQEYAAYLEQLQQLWQLLYQATVPGGKLIIQAANMKTAHTKPPTLVPLHWDVTCAARAVGWLLYDEIIWLKMKSHTGSHEGKALFGSYPYPGNPKILNGVFENIAVLNKPGQRPPQPPEIKAADQLPWEYWKEATNGLWEIPSKADPEHPATFSPELAERIIRLYSYQGETVLDPFAGTGTTLIEAERLNRRGLGFELRPEYLITAAKRAESRLAQLPLQLTPPVARTKAEQGGLPLPPLR